MNRADGGVTVVMKHYGIKLAEAEDAVMGDYAEHVAHVLGLTKEDNAMVKRLDTSGGHRLDEIEATLKALVTALTRLELVGSQRLDQLEADAFERFNGIDVRLDTVGEAVVTLIQRLDRAEQDD